ncbi:MAG TPA: PAS domain-containing protein, partial [Stellaceae bacterium]|nr:PAS domain-containing protein [Stellaceae bacterium]
MILDQTAARPIPATYSFCGPDTDRSSWNPRIAQFFDYWLSIKPGNGLPGRQHFDPLDIPLLMPRVWMLDVLRAPLRYRYRLAGTKEVETLQREVTGLMFDEV